MIQTKAHGRLIIIIIHLEVEACPIDMQDEAILTSLLATQFTS